MQLFTEFPFIVYGNLKFVERRKSFFFFKFKISTLSPILPPLRTRRPGRPQHSRTPSYDPDVRNEPPSVFHPLCSYSTSLAIITHAVLVRCLHKQSFSGIKFCCGIGQIRSIHRSRYLFINNAVTEKL